VKALRHAVQPDLNAWLCEKKREGSTINDFFHYARQATQTTLQAAQLRILG
jgi:hypothetical protein